jgi:hypothetical protein
MNTTSTQTVKYYNPSRNWRKIKPHLTNPRVVKTLHRDFRKYTWGRWRQEFPSLRGSVPLHFESCDWHCEHRGRKPAYWDYVKHAACHWLVNFNPELAKLVMPERKWRILTSDEHSTVYDGKHTLFDLNFLALGVPAEECFSMANVKQLPPGKQLKVYLADHYTKEL